ncbi:MAG: GNAT family N-acetyltransferase [Treponema sp.]|nr:GNAT family N-acetyltransferase [Treponema sp.]
MTFALTQLLVDNIQTALENQEKSFIVDAENCGIIEKNDSVTVDDEKFYNLPEWTSADGFKLREDFVNNLYSPLAREELQGILHSGRGVFKSFRNVLKKYPEVEKKWHVFKNRTMNKYINDWYNSLREIWGLEKLDYIPESDEMLIHDDFSFSEYNSDNQEEIFLNISAALKTEYGEISEEIIAAFSEMWKSSFLSFDSSSQIGYLCRSLSDDFAGCITAAPVSENNKKVMILTSLFVSNGFRGLGIGTELLSMCLAELKRNGKDWILLPNIILPESLEQLLIRTGFEKIGSGYAAKLL